MCLAIAAATDIAEVLHPDAAHAVQAVEALHAMYGACSQQSRVPPAGLLYAECFDCRITMCISWC